jgi:hypothetical protein
MYALSSNSSVPDIAPSDLEAARRFLIGDGPAAPTAANAPASPARPRTGRSRHEVKTPVCHQGIARARVRSSSLKSA